MERKEFGYLISLLRRDLNLTQFKLAENSGVDLAIISQIERGVKKYFDPDMLYQLANALHLNTIERREFFLASSGVDQQHIIRQPSAALATDTVDAKKVLGKMVNILEHLNVPAYIMDVYGDILAVNKTGAAFFQVTPELLSSAPLQPGGYNAIRVMFGKELSIRSKVSENWDHYAVGSMRALRENSLRYRTKPYFQYLMKIFSGSKDFPLFDRYWRMASSSEQDREATLDVFSYTHSDFGHITYTTTSASSTTGFGEIFLVQYLALDEHTKTLFQNLAGASGNGAIAPLASWPNKKIQ